MRGLNFKRVRGWIFLLTILFVGSLPQPSFSQVSLTLKDAVLRGIKTNETYRVVVADQERARQRVKEARSGAFPDVRFNASYQRAFQIPVLVLDTMRFSLGTRHTSDWGITVEQSLWQGGRVFAGIAAAGNYRRLTDASARQVQIDLQASIARAYFDAVLARQMVEVSEQTMAVAEENLVVVGRKYAQGLVSEYDNLRAQVQVSNRRPSLIQSRNARALADSRLRTLIGLEDGIELELADSVPDSSAWEAADLDQLADDAFDKRYDVQASAYEIAMRENAVSAARADYWPSLKLVGDFRWQAYSDEFPFRNDDVTRSWTGMITLSYPIFDGFRRSGSVGIAKVDLVQSRLRHSDLRKGVALELEQARSSFLEANERLEAQRETVAQAARGLEIANIRYESGVGTQLEVMDAQLELTTARINAATARHDRLVARAQWRRAMGEPVLAELAP